MDTYYNILKIAKDFNIKIPICFTMKYLDKEDISGIGTPLEHIDELIDFLNKNSQYIEIDYHGLTHEYEGHSGDLYCLDINKPVPEENQREHIEKSKEIFEYWGLKFPELFVSPYHVWQEGVTDKILSEFGVKYLVSYKTLKYKGFKYRWYKSNHLEFLPRVGLGINSNDYNLDGNMTRKIKFFPEKDIVDFVKYQIRPQSIFIRLRMQKSLFNFSVHGYMIHIGNFTPSFYNFWEELLNWVKENKQLHLCSDNYEAIELFSRVY
ncbi:MAG TPA: DUF2334 domain-containing protein [Candidatus Ratteibacteria bacterium]|nr:DUF2334 domain-containing protein [Candidatus Ratteibacteria bacterium]